MTSKTRTCFDDLVIFLFSFFISPHLLKCTTSACVIISKHHLMRSNTQKPFQERLDLQLSQATSQTSTSTSQQAQPQAKSKTLSFPCVTPSVPSHPLTSTNSLGTPKEIEGISKPIQENPTQSLCLTENQTMMPDTNPTENSSGIKIYPIDERKKIYYNCWFERRPKDGKDKRVVLLKLTTGDWVAVPETEMIFGFPIILNETVNWLDLYDPIGFRAFYSFSAIRIPNKHINFKFGKPVPDWEIYKQLVAQDMLKYNW